MINLSAAPYNDDYTETKDFYKILFQPGVSVQVRELNQLQSIFQKQIERFGDNIFSSGSILSGCNFQYYNPYSYIKIKDIDFSGDLVVPSRYLGYNVLNETTGLRGIVVNTQDGFESTSPDLKTLYVSYRNSSDDTATHEFAAGDTLKVFDPVVNGIEGITIVGGGLGFANNDRLIATSQVVLSVSSGTLTNNDFLLNSLGANVEIIGIDSATLASANQFIVAVAPRVTDLTNSAANSVFWTLNVGDSVTNPAATLTASVIRKIGSGFSGKIVTDSVGTIIRTQTLSKGVSYNSLPYITVRSINNPSGYNTLNLAPKNYITKVIVSNEANSVGNGYAFGISTGVIYQKGYLLRVDPQIILISKYDTIPNNVAVGFITTEEIIDYNIDPSLLDNVNDTQNAQAPGANRLRLTPQIQVTSSDLAAANASFFTIAEWQEGRPVKISATTDYSVIGDEMASRTKDASGNFVTDPFLVTTRSALDANNEGEFFNIVIDPGNAYIDGYRVNTTANFNIQDRKGTDTATLNSHSVSLNYGNYVIIKNVVGTFGFAAGDSVNLYDTAKGILADPTSIEAGSLTPGGAVIGTANIRMMTYLSGTPGTSVAQYKLYLFNVQMSTGKNFKNVRAVYYNGTKKGVGDIVTVLDTTTNTQIASIIDPTHKTLLFYCGVDSPKNANACTYTYRSVSTSQTVSNGGSSNASLVIDISSGSDIFPYSGSLSSSQLTDLYVVPTQVDMVANDAITGTFTANSTTANAIGSSSTFLTDLAVGDWVTVAANSTAGSDLRQVLSITNNTFLTLSSNCSFSNTSAKLYRTYPLNVPVPFGIRTGLSANVNVNQNIMTLDFGSPFSFSATKTATVAYNAEQINVSQLTKTPNRNKFVRLCLSNNAGTTTGPWAMGIPDVFRLSGVYVGNSTVSNTGTNYIKNFFVDHNQNPDYYNMSYLYKDPKSGLSLGSGDYLLVQFDYFTRSGAGFFDVVSYRQTSDADTIFLQDSQPLSNLASVVNSFEIPEVFTDSGQEIDLIQYFDFRPSIANTVNPAATPGSAPLNPANTVGLTLAGDNKFPLPDSSFLNVIEYFVGRTDTVFVDKKGRFSVIEGHPNFDPLKRIAPQSVPNALRLADISIPSYPCLPANYSFQLDQLLNTRVLNQKFATSRINFKTISTPNATKLLPWNQPKVYTQSDIGNLDRRLKDVEYYVTLNSLETGTSSKVIPSSVDPSLDRFKFGIFVDDFTSSQFSDLANPQYIAIKEGTDIVPTKMKWDLTLFGAGPPDWIVPVPPPPPIIITDPPPVPVANTPQPPPIIIQPIVTVSDPFGAGPICALNLANTVAYQMKFRNATDSLANTTTLANTDIVNLTFADHTTVQFSIASANGAISEFIQNQQYNLFDSSIINSVIGTHDNQHTIDDLGGANTQLLSAILNGILSNDPINDPFNNEHAITTYNAATGTLNIKEIAQGIVQDNITLQGISPAVANALSQLLQQQISLTQFAGMLQVNQNIPAGGSLSGSTYLPPAILYFYNYDQGVKIEVFQGTTLVASTDTSLAGSGVSTPSSLTDEEIALLTGPHASQWFNDYPGYFLSTFTDLGAGYVKNAGKLSFNYASANGANFTVKTTRSNNSTRWRWVMAYPINGDSVGCIPSAVTPSISANYSNTAADFNIRCGNWTAHGSVNILTGVTATYSIPSGTPSTVVAPFDISADWLGLAPGTSSGLTVNPTLPAPLHP
jgi:hypothetical protein